MGDEFVRIGSFKEFKDACRERHKDYEAMREELKAFRECFYKKMNKMQWWLIGVLGALLINVIVMWARSGHATP